MSSTCLPARRASPTGPTGSHPAVVAALRRTGVERPWTHQVEAARSRPRAENVVVATGTASGKSLAYQLPVLSTLMREPRATALYLAPTKALGADQLRATCALIDAGGLDAGGSILSRRAPTTATPPPRCGSGRARTRGGCSPTRTCCTWVCCAGTTLGAAAAQPALRRGRRMPRLPRRVRVQRGIGAAPAAADRAHVTAPIRCSYSRRRPRRIPEAPPPG